MARATTKVQNDARARMAYALRLRGKSNEEIAAALATSDRNVSRLVALGKKIAKSDMIEAIGADGMIAEFATISHIQAEALDGWHRSKEDKKKVIKSGESVEAKGKDGATVTAPTKRKASESVEAQVGDPRFLQVAMTASQRKADMLGTDAPKAIRKIKDEDDPQTPEGAKSVDDLVKLGRDELRRILGETLRLGEEAPGR